MRTALVIAAAASLLAQAPAREHRVPVGNVQLYARDIGRGRAIVVLHGGPDFDHTYLLPDLDRLSDRYRLIYYDQRGRGRSATGVEPDDVSLQSDVADVDAVRRYFHVDQAIVLGHSWGTVLALEYALKHADSVSHLILMNPAPASAADYARFRQIYRDKQGANFDRLRAIAGSDAYKNAAPEAVMAYYRIHFTPALERPADLDKLMAIMRPSFETTDVLKARKIEEQLNQDTWLSPGYDLIPRIAKLRIPTLVVYGDHDFFPADMSQHIAAAMPNARMVTMNHCGHFSYMECPAAVRGEIDRFMAGR